MQASKPDQYVYVIPESFSYSSTLLWNSVFKRKILARQCPLNNDLSIGYFFRFSLKSIASFLYPHSPQLILQIPFFCHLKSIISLKFFTYFT